MKRPEFENVCPSRIRNKSGAYALFPYGKEQEHEILMVQVPRPDLGDGMLTPIVELPFYSISNKYDDDEGGKFNLTLSACKHCGGMYTVTEDA